jgi:hypothetical protein
MEIMKKQAKQIEKNKPEGKQTNQLIELTI